MTLNPLCSNFLPSTSNTGLSDCRIIALLTSASSGLMSVVFTAGIYVSGLASADLRGFGDIVQVHPAVAMLVSAIGWALPAFSEFDIKSQVVHGMPVAPQLVAGMVGYAAIYSASVVALSVALFARREFK